MENMKEWVSVLEARMRWSNKRLVKILGENRKKKKNEVTTILKFSG